MRAFVALELPPAQKERLGRAQACMQRAVHGSYPRWVGPDQLHLTLKFLGEVDPGLEPRLVALLQNAARQIEPIETRFEKLSTFGSAARPRVVVVLLRDALGRLAGLASRIDHDCAGLGVPREQRGFVPHVTLARIKRPHDPAPYLAQAEVDSSDFVLHELVLYRSELRPAGPCYTALFRAGLGGA